MADLTTAQQQALKWLAAHGGDGLRMGYGTVLARGEESPHGNATWPRLEAAGLVERYGDARRRLRLTEAGWAEAGEPNPCRLSTGVIDVLGECVRCGAVPGERCRNKGVCAYDC